MSGTVSDSQSLRPAEVERLGITAVDLIADRNEGVAYPTETARQAADAFARALRKEPVATLRAFQLALRRVQVDMREEEAAS